MFLTETLLNLFLSNFGVWDLRFFLVQTIERRGFHKYSLDLRSIVSAFFLFIISYYMHNITNYRRN